MQMTLTTATMSSHEIAELTDKRHDNVKRTISDLHDAGLIGNPQIEEIRTATKPVQVFLLGKRDTLVVVARLSPEFTARVVDRWQELEEQAAPALPRTMAQALRLAADQAEQLEQQQAALALAAPKVDFVDRYVQADGAKGFREVAKLLKVNEAEFSQFLQDHKVMYRLAGRMTPYQCHIDAGRFVVRTGVAAHNSHAFTAAKFTPKGIEWMAGELAKHRLALERSAA